MFTDVASTVRLLYIPICFTTVQRKDYLSAKQSTDTRSTETARFAVCGPGTTVYSFARIYLIFDFEQFISNISFDGVLGIY